MLHGQPMDGPAVVAGGRDVQIKGVFLGNAAPGRARADQAPHRIDRASRPEHALGVGERLGQRHESGAHVDLARRVPVRNAKDAGPARLIDLDGVLQGAHGRDVLGIVGVDENAHDGENIARADPLLRQRKAAGAVDDLGRVGVLVDRLHRQDAPPRVRQRDRRRARVEIEHGAGIERVAVHPGDRLPVERGRFAAVDEFAEARVLHHAAEIEVQFGVGKILRRNGDRRSCRTGRRRPGQGRRRGDEQNQLHPRLLRQCERGAGRPIPEEERTFGPLAANSVGLTMIRQRRRSTAESRRAPAAAKGPRPGLRGMKDFQAKVCLAWALDWR